VVKGLAVVVVSGLAVASASAQSDASQQSASTRAQAQSRYQIGQMERVLEGAVEHGANLTRVRLQSVLPPGDTTMSGDNARARGFRLEGYGVFFDVTVPPFDTETTLAWSVRTLDQNDLGLNSALKELRDYVKTANSADLEQALKRVELQVAPAQQVAVAPLPQLAGAAPRMATGSAATASAGAAQAQSAAADSILADPNEAYRTEVMQALKEAMLDHSASLGIAPSEWLTVAARGNDDRPRLAPADSDARTRTLRLSGVDLAAYLARQITRDEALQRIEIRTY
jgi:hypothetical protein